MLDDGYQNQIKEKQNVVITPMLALSNKTNLNGTNTYR